MALEVKLQLKQTQKLVMTVELRQAIELLTLSRLELQQIIKEKLLENPVLEETTEPVSEEEALPISEEEIFLPADKVHKDDPTSDKPLNEVDWEYFLQSYHENYGTNLSCDFSEDSPNLENIIASKETLSEHLHKQLALVVSDDEESKTGSLIIGNLDENGFLSMTLDEMAQRYTLDRDKLQHVHSLFRNFDPDGIAAENIQQCLIIQLENREEYNPLAMEILTNHMEDLKSLNLKKLADICGATEEDIRIALYVIKSLDPRPARNFGGEETRYIQPDVFVVKVDNEYVVHLNDDGFNNLKISQSYKEMIHKLNSHNKEAKDYLEQKMRSAVWLLKTIQQRQRTIYKVAKSIVRKQRDFFEQGISYLKPMVLREVAEDISLHECTVSRVTNNKYMHTPHGIFELKFFFTSGITAGDGDSVSSKSIKNMIKDIIQNEDKSKPLSDEKIAQILASQKLYIARRTIAKYREELNFLPSSKRKKII